MEIISQLFYFYFHLISDQFVVVPFFVEAEQI